MAGFLGMRGTGDWATDERPYNWRQGILYLYPNGSAPLTAILSKMKEESVDDPQYHWWTKLLPAQGGAVTGVYTNATLASGYTSGGVVGDTLYIKMAEANADEVRVGHQVMLRDASNQLMTVVTKVTAVVKNGASSYLAVKLLEADDNGSTSDLSDCDTFLIIGNINAEGAARPDPIAYNPTKFYNYTQIFRNSLSITRTAKKTHLRTVESYKEAKREALELHSVEMEKAFLWGIRSENTGANGKPERTTYGLIPFIKDNAAANVFDAPSSSGYSSTWVTYGEDWLDESLEVIFRYGSGEKLAFCGSGALLGIQRLAKAGANITLTPRATSYGIKILEWVTPFGIINLKTHPLFSYNAVDRNNMVIFEPSNLIYKYIDDTKFIPSKQEGGDEGKDGIDEEYLTEAGLEFHHPATCGILTGMNTAHA